MTQLSTTLVFCPFSRVRNTNASRTPSSNAMRYSQLLIQTTHTTTTSLSLHSDKFRNISRFARGSHTIDHHDTKPDDYILLRIKDYDPENP